jgi:hypothetical protein
MLGPIRERLFFARYGRCTLPYCLLGASVSLQTLVGSFPNTNDSFGSSSQLQGRLAKQSSRFSSCYLKLQLPVRRSHEGCLLEKVIRCYGGSALASSRPNAGVPPLRFAAADAADFHGVANLSLRLHCRHPRAIHRLQPFTRSLVGNSRVAL